MSEARPPTEYFPGDEIRIRVAITSSTNIHAVEIIYAHPGYPWITLTLEGSADLEETSHTYGSRKRFVAVVSGVPEDHHEPGVYEVVRIMFYTFTGVAVVYDREGRVSPGSGIEGEEGTTAYGLTPERWPMLAINPDPFKVLDVTAEIAEDDEP